MDKPHGQRAMKWMMIMNATNRTCMALLGFTFAFLSSAQAAEVAITNIPTPITKPTRSKKARAVLVDQENTRAWRGAPGRNELTVELSTPTRITSFALTLGKRIYIRKVSIEASTTGQSFSEIYSSRKLRAKRGETIDFRGFDVTASVFRLRLITKRGRERKARRQNSPRITELQLREFQSLGSGHPSGNTSGGTNGHSTPSPTPSPSNSQAASPTATPTPVPISFQNTQVVSVSSAGDQSEGDSEHPSISDDGRFVAFDAIVKNLLPGSNSNLRAVFVRDRQSGTTELIGKNGLGLPIFSTDPSISGDGRFIAYSAGNHIWLYDRQLGQTELVSQSSAGVQSNAACKEPFISADGQTIVFQCFDSNMDITDNNTFLDIYVRDRVKGTTTLISKSSAGQIGNSDANKPSVSDDGRYVVWDSRADNLVVGDGNATADVFIRDRQLGTTSLVSLNDMGLQANDESDGAEISGDGSYVVFQSFATNLVAGTTDRNIFLHNVSTDENYLVTADLNGNPTAENFHPSVSSNGRFIAFDSPSENLVGGDNNGYRDTFIHDSARGETFLVSRGTSGVQGNADSAGGMGREKSLSGDGKHIAFLTEATNLFPNDSNNRIDVLVAEMQ